MTDCPFQPQLDAYHDGELAPQAAQRLEEHLDACPACMAELREMRDLSARIRFAAGPESIEREEARRLHATLERAIEEQQPDNSGLLLRLATKLSVAASVLLVGGIWLLELTPHSSKRESTMSPQPAPQLVVSPEWERIALTQHVDPRPELLNQSPDFPISPSNLAVNRMLDDLTPNEEMPWAKRDSF
jgi:anti-sigma factor RsiW